MLIYFMSVEKSPKIISVTGAHSNAGKTTVCSILLKNLKNFGAVKFTKTPLYTSIIEDTGILSQKGKDTAVFLESGAEKVLWVQSPYSGLKDVLEIALSRMSDLAGVIVEGNSPVDFLNPHLVVFIIGEKGNIKPSAFKICKKADAIIINSEKQTTHRAFLEKCPGAAKVFRIDLLKKKGEINEFLSFVKERISSRAH
jgi:molybdopterin-guanine dinucleotide biosynthesis protein MobB